MAMRQTLPPPEPPPRESDDTLYDETIADSFPASDPPAGVIKVGPRQPRQPAQP